MFSQDVFIYFVNFNNWYVKFHNLHWTEREWEKNGINELKNNKLSMKHSKYTLERRVIER